MADDLLKGAIGRVDDLPLFKLATSILMDAPGKLGALAVSAGNLIADGATAVFDSVKNTSIGAVALGSSMLSKDSPSQEVSRAPAKEMDTPAVSRASQHEVSISELGSFSPPTFGSVSVQAGIGRG